MPLTLPNFLFAPRAGFFTLFLVLSVGMSRFTSLFLRDRHLTDSQIGIALGVSSLNFLAVPFFTAFADKTNDRTAALLCMTLIGTVLVFLQGFVDLGIVSIAAAPTFLTILRFLIASSLAPQSPVLDALAVDGNLKIENYGHERLWGAVSWGLMHLLIGGLIDVSGTYILFYLMIFSAICYLGLLYIWRHWRDAQEKEMDIKSNDNDGNNERNQMAVSVVVPTSTTTTNDDTEMDQSILTTSLSSSSSPSSPSTSIIQLLGEQFKFAFSSFKVSMFLLDIFFLSAGTSVVEGLLFLFFASTMKASNFLLGWTVVMTVLFEIPLFAYSNKIMSKYSTRQLMAVAHVAYVVRVFGYTFIPPDYSGFILMFEPLHGVTYALKQMCAVTVLANLAPKGFKNSAQGVVSTVARLGGLTGSIAGGFVLQYLGSTVLYRGAGVLVSVAGVLYLGSDKWCDRSHSNKREGVEVYQEMDEMTSEDIEVVDTID